MEKRLSAIVNERLDNIKEIGQIVKDKEILAGITNFMVSVARISKEDTKMGQVLVNDIRPQKFRDELVSMFDLLKGKQVGEDLIIDIVSSVMIVYYVHTYMLWKILKKDEQKDVSKIEKNC